MPYLRDTVYILKSEPYREHDAWISMYGREHGKLEAVARGVRNLHAKHLGHLEPLTKAEVMIATGVSFDKLAVAHASGAQTDLRLRLDAITMIGGFARLLNRLTRPGVADADLFHLMDELNHTWRMHQREPSSERVRFLSAAAASRLLASLGYATEMPKGASDDAVKLLSVLPTAPLSFSFAVTAPISVLLAVSQAVETSTAALLT